MLRNNQVDDNIGNKKSKTRETAACPYIRTLKPTLNEEISIIPRSFDVGTPDRLGGVNPCVWKPTSSASIALPALISVACSLRILGRECHGKDRASKRWEFQAAFAFFSIKRYEAVFLSKDLRTVCADMSSCSTAVSKCVPKGEAKMAHILWR